MQPDNVSKQPSSPSQAILNTQALEQLKEELKLENPNSDNLLDLISKLKDEIHIELIEAYALVLKRAYPPEKNSDQKLDEKSKFKQLNEIAIFNLGNKFLELINEVSTENFNFAQHQLFRYYERWGSCELIEAKREKMAKGLAKFWQLLYQQQPLQEKSLFPVFLKNLSEFLNSLLNKERYQERLTLFNQVFQGGELIFLEDLDERKPGYHRLHLKHIITALSTTELERPPVYSCVLDYVDVNLEDKWKETPLITNCYLLNTCLLELKTIFTQVKKPFQIKKGIVLITSLDNIKSIFQKLWEEIIKSSNFTPLELTGVSHINEIFSYMKWSMEQENFTEDSDATCNLMINLLLMISELLVCLVQSDNSARQELNIINQLIFLIESSKSESVLAHQFCLNNFFGTQLLLTKKLVAKMNDPIPQPMLSALHKLASIYVDRLTQAGSTQGLTYPASTVIQIVDSKIMGFDLIDLMVLVLTIMQKNQKNNDSNLDFEGLCIRLQKELGTLFIKFCINLQSPKNSSSVQINASNCNVRLRTLLTEIGMQPPESCQNVAVTAEFALKTVKQKLKNNADAKQSDSKIKKPNVTDNPSEFSQKKRKQKKDKNKKYKAQKKQRDTEKKTKNSVAGKSTNPDVKPIDSSQSQSSPSSSASEKKLGNPDITATTTASSSESGSTIIPAAVSTFEMMEPPAPENKENLTPNNTLNSANNIIPASTPISDPQASNQGLNPITSLVVYQSPFSLFHRDPFVNKQEIGAPQSETPEPKATTNLHNENKNEENQNRPQAQASIQPDTSPKDTLKTDSHNKKNSTINSLEDQEKKLKTQTATPRKEQEELQQINQLELEVQHLSDKVTNEGNYIQSLIILLGKQNQQIEELQSTVKSQKKDFQDDRQALFNQLLHLIEKEKIQLTKKTLQQANQIKTLESTVDSQQKKFKEEQKKITNQVDQLKDEIETKQDKLKIELLTKTEQQVAQVDELKLELKLQQQKSQKTQQDSLNQVNQLNDQVPQEKQQLTELKQIIIKLHDKTEQQKKQINDLNSVLELQKLCMDNMQNLESEMKMGKYWLTNLMDANTKTNQQTEELKLECDFQKNRINRRVADVTDLKSDMKEAKLQQEELIAENQKIIEQQNQRIEKLETELKSQKELSDQQTSKVEQLTLKIVQLEELMAKNTKAKQRTTSTSESKLDPRAETFIPRSSSQLLPSSSSNGFDLSRSPRVSYANCYLRPVSLGREERVSNVGYPGWLPLPMGLPPGYFINPQINPSLPATLPGSFHYLGGTPPTSIPGTNVYQPVVINQQYSPSYTVNARGTSQFNINTLVTPDSAERKITRRPVVPSLGPLPIGMDLMIPTSGSALLEGQDSKRLLSQNIARTLMGGSGIPATTTTNVLERTESSASTSTLK